MFGLRTAATYRAASNSNRQGEFSPPIFRDLGGRADSKYSAVVVGRRIAHGQEFWRAIERRRTRVRRLFFSINVTNSSAKETRESLTNVVHIKSLNTV